MVGAGGFAAYNTYFQRNNISIWTLIPENSLLVYESSNAIKAWEDFGSTNIGKNLQGIDAFARTGRYFSKLDTIVKGKAAELFENKPFVVSLHSTGSNELDVLLIMEINSLENHSRLREIIDYFSEGNGFSVDKRNYQGYVISEVRRNRDIFTFLYYQNFIIGSFTPFLVEDAIRNIEEQTAGFFERNHEVTSLSKLQNDQGNLYLNTSRLARFLDTFSDERQFDTELVNSLGKVTFLDVKTAEELLLMNGFTLLPPDYRGYLSGFAGNPAQPLEMEEMVSNRAALYFTLTFASAADYNEKMTAYWQENSPSVLRLRDSSLRKHDLAVESLFDGFGQQVGLSVEEASFGRDAGKVLYLQVKDLAESVKQLNELAGRISAGRGDTVYYEEYASYTVRQLEIEEFPYQLFGSPFRGFSSFYYTAHDQYLLAANTVQTLKNAIDDIANENTWGKSVRVSSFLDNTLSEANLSIFIHTPRVWQQWQQLLDEPWVKSFADQAARLKAIEFMAVQLSFVEDKFYTSVVAQQTEKPLLNLSQKPLLADNSLKFSQHLATKPFVVRNHNDRSLEVVVQDKDSLFYLISQQQEVLWADSLKGLLNSPVYQIDYYKNDKLQYLFSTPRHLYAIDRTGEYLPGFPVEFKGKNDIAYLSLIDYDKSKNYRYFIADTRGNLFITDKDGKTLDGWNPKEGKFPLAVAPFHIRVRGQDFLIAARSHGVIEVFNRRGQSIKGFPLDLKSPLSNPIFVEIGSGNANTRLSTVTDEGAIVQLNLDGKITMREQLYRPSSQSKFRLIPEASGKDFVLMRQDDNQIAILDKNGNQLFQKDYLSGSLAVGQFYDFGSGRQLYILHDPSQAFSYLYNEKGDLIHLRPVETEHEVGVLFYEAEGSYKIYRNYRDEFAVLSLKR